MHLPNNIDFIAYFAEATFECYFDKYMFLLQHGRKRSEIREMLQKAYIFFKSEQSEIPPPPHHTTTKK